MKKFNIFIFLAAVIFALCSGSVSAFADEPNPPVVPGQHGQGGDVPVGAPVDGGMSLLLILGAGYGVKKLIPMKDVKTAELNDHNTPE
jgi:hypothetical protein